MRKQKRHVRYIIQDFCFEDFEIMATFSGWWADLNKVHQVISGIKEGRKLKNILKKTGITKKQWRRFVEVHPTFNHLRYTCRDKLRVAENGGARHPLFGFWEEPPPAKYAHTEPTRIIIIEDALTSPQDSEVAPPVLPTTPNLAAEALPPKEIRCLTVISPEPIKLPMPPRARVRKETGHPPTEDIICLPEHKNCYDCWHRASEEKERKQLEKIRQQRDISKLPKPLEVGFDYERDKGNIGRWLADRQLDFSTGKITPPQYFACRDVFRSHMIEINARLKARQDREWHG